MTTSHPSTAFKQQPQQNKATHKKAEQPLKDSGQARHPGYPKTGKDDRFSAAMSALGSLDISSPGTLPQQGAAPMREGGADKMAARPRQELGRPKTMEGPQNAKKTGGGGEKSERELSPSVAAIFEAAGKRSGEGKPGSDISMATGANTRSERVAVDSESSTALKNLLNIGAPPPSNYPAPQGDPPPDVPEAVRKLMRPSLAPPLGHPSGPGLLPNPYNTHHFMRG